MRLIIKAFILFVLLVPHVSLSPKMVKFAGRENENIYEVASSNAEENIAVASEDTEKFIKIDLSEQKLQLWQNNEMVGEYAVSTGKPGMKTPTGEFRILGKEENHWSVKYHLYMPHSLRFYTDYFIHELPYWPGGYREGEEHLGMPVSHGCVRLGIGPAKIVYDWAEIGTSMLVVD